MVLVLDDLHWADKPSLLLLRHLVRRLGDSRLVVFGTYRDVELDRRHPLAEVLAELRRERLYERILKSAIEFGDLKVRQIMTPRTKIEYLVLDRPEDLAVVTRVFEHFHPRRDFGWLDVLELQDRHPDWFVVNQHFVRNERVV